MESLHAEDNDILPCKKITNFQSQQSDAFKYNGSYNYDYLNGFTGKLKHAVVQSQSDHSQTKEARQRVDFSFEEFLS